MFNTILVPLDMENSHPGSRALPAARELADKHGAKIILIHIIPHIPAIVAQNLPAGHEKKVIAEIRKEMQALVKAYDLAEDTQIRVIHGAVYPEIIQCAADENVDVIIMASHRPGLSDYLLGSVAARVVRHSKSSVLVLR